jgi:hypothetical protein
VIHTDCLTDRSDRIPIGQEVQMISGCGLGERYGGVHAVDGLSFDLTPGAGTARTSRSGPAEYLAAGAGVLSLLGWTAAVAALALWRVRARDV